MNPGEGFGAQLIILVPDRHYRAAIEALLARRQSLGIRQVPSVVYQHPRHDPGCLTHSAAYLGQFLPTQARAIVLFDREGCGHEDTAAADLEAAVRAEFRRAGWGDRVEAVVLDPELEAWVWSDSPEVDRCLGWESRDTPLRKWLEQRSMWKPGAAKPHDPKSAMLAALRESRKGADAPIFAALARSVSLRRCTDRAFVRFREILQRWFPAEPRQSEP